MFQTGQPCVKLARLWSSATLPDFDHVYWQDCIPTSLLKLSADNASRAVKMFAGVQKYMVEGGEQLTNAQCAELVQKLLHQGIKRPELKDELYMQLLKQSRGNSTPSVIKVSLLQLLACFTSLCMSLLCCKAADICT